MKKRFAVLSYLLLLALSFPAQQAQSSRQEPLEAGLRAHIDYLASARLEGRRTGEPGATAASEYIAGQFKKFKLKPLGAKKGSFFQPFPYVTGVEVAPAGNEFRLQIAGETAYAKAAVAKPVGFSPNADVQNVPVVFSGFGILSAEQKHDDYANVDANGKIVLIFDGSPDNDNPHSPLGQFNTRTKALIARDKGASGILVISREPNIEDDKLGRLTFDQTLGEAALPILVISRSTAANILGIDDSALTALETGKTTRDANTRAVAGFKINLTKRTSEARNVIGVLAGTDPVLKNEAIVVGAHYDHLGRGGQGSLDVNSSEIHHGADDNASGTAAILQLAERFAQERTNKRTIIFMAFSGEEEGLLGSKFYVNNPLYPLENTVAMFNLDMVGRLNGDKLNIGGIGTATEWKKLVEDLNGSGGVLDTAKANVRKTTFSNAAGLGSQFNLQLNEDGFGPSDHSSFYGKKVPVLFFFTGTHNDYHKPSDTPEKINYEGEAKIIRYISEIVRSVDQSPARPTYTVAKSSGMGGRTGFNISLGTVPNYADSTDGLLLDGVRDNSPAANAGIKPGDKIVRLAGKDIRNAMDYTYVLGEMKAGQEYEIVVLRGGERLTLKVVPVRR